MTSTSHGLPNTPIEIAVHADAALRTVRILLAVLSFLLIGAYRPLTGPPSWVALAMTLTAIVTATIALNVLSTRTQGRARWASAVQALDVGATVVLAVALDDPLGHQSWVLLVVPVVSAAVRHGALASFLSWIGGCVGYLTAAFVDAIEANADIALLTRIPGTLLAVAITIGLLARWMREGWEIQNDITATIANRERRLATLEQTRHALTNKAPHEALELAANQTLALGFTAVTVHPCDQRRPPILLGDDKIVTTTDASQHNTAHGPVVTLWTDGTDIRSHSVAVHEPRTNTIITAWSRTEIDTDLAQATAALVEITTAAIETTTLLGQLRHAADHDPLTALLNRGALDRKLAELAANPGQLTIAFIDLDDFKHINDSYGHDIGDKALITIARRLEAIAGTHGLVARYGGDEFVALLPNISLEDAERFAQATLHATTAPVALGPTQLRLQLSIGIATTTTPTNPNELLNAADNALHQAKKAGKATYTAIDLDPTRRPLGVGPPLTD